MANNISISTTMFLTFIFIGTLFQSSRVASQIGVYWGQHHGEGSIKDACDSLINYTTINIAFLSTFGCGRTPKLDLAHCDASRGGCRHLGSEIQGCQDKYGATGQRLVSVFLSIGGDGYGEYSLASAADAKQVAAYLWNNYLGGNSTSRPFGDVVLDGIEFNIQKGSNRYWDVLLRELRSYSDELLLVGSPSCSYPDYYLNRAISTGEFNYLWVRFYNDHSCQYNPYGDIENVLETWTTWSTITYNFDGVVYLSLPACSEAAPHGGYIPPYVLNHQVLPRLREDLNYGGVILWDRYYDATTNYSAKISPYVDLNLAKSSS